MYMLVKELGYQVNCLKSEMCLTETKWSPGLLNCSPHLPASVSHNGITFQPELQEKRQIQATMSCAWFWQCSTYLQVSSTWWESGTQRSEDPNMKVTEDIGKPGYHRIQAFLGPSASTGHNFIWVSHGPVTRWWDACQEEQSQETHHCICIWDVLIQSRK